MSWTNIKCKWEQPPSECDRGLYRDVSQSYCHNKSLIKCVFLLKVNLERCTRAVWSCLVRGRSMSPSKPSRRATWRSRGGTSSQKRPLWASLTTQTSSAWRALSPKAARSWSSPSSWRMGLLTPFSGWVILMDQIYSAWSDPIHGWVGCSHGGAENVIGNKVLLLSYQPILGKN